MSEKTFLLLPQSCRCKDSISDESPLIRHRGHLPILTQNRAGVIERQYKNSIYSILDEEENEASVRKTFNNAIFKGIISLYLSLCIPLGFMKYGNMGTMYLYFLIRNET